MKWDVKPGNEVGAILFAAASNVHCEKPFSMFFIWHNFPYYMFSEYAHCTARA